MQGYGHPDPHLLGRGTAAAPSYSFASAPTYGLILATGNNQIFPVINGQLHLSFDASWSLYSLTLGSVDALAWNSGGLAVGSASTPDVVLVRDAAAVLALKNSTTAQAFRVYGTTTGPKYVVLSHDGTNGNLDLIGGGVLILNPTLTGVAIGAANVILNSVAANGGNQMSLTLSSTLASSPGDWSCLRLAPTLTGQTVTRLNYLSLLNQVGTTTVTDGAALHFDAAVGTHKCLASNAAVAVTITSVGPTGAQTTIQGWIKMNINGTLRYVPFW